MCSTKNTSLVDRFPTVLRELRLEKGISQEYLAELAGLHRTYISQIERGIKSPSLKSIEQIAKALDIKPSELIRLMES